MHVEGSASEASISCSERSQACVVARALLDKLKKKEEVKIISDQWNSPTLNVNMAEMILEITEKKVKGIFHFAGATRLSRIEFAEHIAETFNLDKKYIKPVTSEHMKWIAKRPKDSSLDVNKAKRNLASKPLEIREALETMKKEWPQDKSN